MAEFPAMMLWTDAYLADTGHLTAIEHGAYLLLLMAMWRNDGWLPNDDKKLARYARLTPGQWQRIKSTIFAFMQVSSDRITQSRLTDELAAVRQVKKSRQTGAQAKWLKYNKARHASASAKPLQNDAIPQPHPQPYNPPTPKGVGGELFAKFWEAYPKRDGANPKKPAADKFARAVKAGNDPGAIIAGAKAYAASLGEKAGTQFVAQAVTWLNQERWRDYEPIEDAAPYEPPAAWRNGFSEVGAGLPAAWVRNWLHPCIPRQEGSMLMLTAPTGFIADRLRGAYALEVAKIWPGEVKILERSA